MPNYNQAPVIKYNGVKNRDTKKMGTAIRSHELEMAIMCGLGDRDMAALKIMLFLTGNAEGFGVAEKTICERCNMSETGYKNARKKLVDKGWITLIPGKQIIVNYDNIYKELGSTENTSIKNDKKSKGSTVNTSKGLIENTSSGSTENTHNNIRNNISNNISVDSFTIVQESNGNVPKEEEKSSPKEEDKKEVITNGYPQITKTEFMEKFADSLSFARMLKDNKVKIYDTIYQLI